MMKKDENPTRTEFFQIIYKRRKVKKKKRLNFRAGSYFHTTETKTGDYPVQMLLVKIV